MAFCPNCTKYAAYGEPEVEIEHEEIEGRSVEVSVMVTIPCEDCGGGLREISLDWAGEIEHECPEADKELEGEEFELLSVDAEGNQRTEKKIGKRGQPIKAEVRLFGANIDAHVKCLRCGNDKIHAKGLVEDVSTAFDDIT